MLPNHVIRIQICLLFDRSSSLIDFDYLANVQKTTTRLTARFQDNPYRYQNVKSLWLLLQQETTDAAIATTERMHLTPVKSPASVYKHSDFLQYNKNKIYNNEIKPD